MTVIDCPPPPLGDDPMDERGITKAWQDWLGKLPEAMNQDIGAFDGTLDAIAEDQYAQMLDLIATQATLYQAMLDALASLDDTEALLAASEASLADAEALLAEVEVQTGIANGLTAMVHWNRISLSGVAMASNYFSQAPPWTPTSPSLPIANHYAVRVIPTNGNNSYPGLVYNGWVQSGQIVWSVSNQSSSNYASVTQTATIIVWCYD